MSLKLTILAAGALLAVSSTGAFADTLTENQARSVLGNECNNVSTLSRDSKGGWHGSCSKGAMMVDSTGKVSPDKGGIEGGLTEAHARSAMLAKCNNVSTLSQDTAGNWHGVCSSGAMMVDAKGMVGPDKGGVENGLTEAHARSVALDSCNNVSTLHTDGSGTWMGSCTKGSFAIDKTGKIAFK